MKPFLFVAVGAMLFVVNWWYVRSCYRSFFSTDLPEVVARFQYVGVKDEEINKGQAMALMLAARLGSLQHEIRAAQDALQTGSIEEDVDERAKRDLMLSSRASPALLKSPDRPSPIRLQARVVEIPKLDLKVSGVDVSGVVTWIYRALAEGRAMRVTVHGPNAAKTYSVAVNLETEGIDDIWLKDLPGDDVSVVNEVALEVLRLQSLKTNTIPEAGGLDRSEFGRLIDALRQVAELNNRVRNDAEPTKAEYLKVVGDLEPLIARTPRWRSLVALAAAAAENGRDVARAISLYERDLELLKKSNGRSASSDSEQSSLEQKISGLRQALESRKLRELLAVPEESALGAGVRVGILGGVPLDAQLKELGSDVTLVDNPDVGNEQSEEMREHVGTVASVIRLIAPSAHLVFAPMRSQGGTAVSYDILLSLDQLSSNDVKVLVIPLGLDHGNSEVILHVLDPIVTKSILVLPAGNDGKDSHVQFAKTTLIDRAIIAGAVDASGKMAEFSSGQTEKRVLWAPGVSIPVRVRSGTRMIEQSSDGTSYSAAIAAAAATAIIGVKPDLKPADVIDLLRKTSKPLKDGGPPVIQLGPALQEASK